MSPYGEKTSVIRVCVHLYEELSEAGKYAIPIPSYTLAVTDGQKDRRTDANDRRFFQETNLANH